MFPFVGQYSKHPTLWNNAVMGNAEARARKLLRRAGTLRARELVTAGIARAQLSRLVEAGALIRLSRGVYALAERSSNDTDDGLRIIAERLPHPRLCLLSALRLHGLTTQAPFEHWVAIGNSDRAPRIDWPPLRVVRMSATTLNAGLEERRVGRRLIYVSNAAKTVVDCFKFRNLVGLDVALEALRDALHSRATTPNALMEYARICRVARLMRPYLDALA
ncbi:type IV toxin-antitoxin system AbiEi family antitoxin domain-containing protein [Stenotrophomonas maltophilia]|nr:type IV toxin-antitoxin system AbiEi family antitoxin domain-containing protein [Stenotrophomonas maltophilia]